MESKTESSLNQNAKDLTVYYDGLCKVCSREINHYRKQQGSEKILFIDICSSQFDAAKENLDPFAIHKIMHARKKDGTLLTRVDAFIEIWKTLPKYRWLARIAEQSSIKFFLEKGYSFFIIVRPFLPRYSPQDCENSPYCDIHH